MFRLILEKELRDIIGSRKFVLSFSACAVIILLAFFMGARNYHAGVAEYNAGKAENAKQLEGLTTDEWYRVEPKLFLPPEPVSALVTGVSNDIGRTVEVRGRGQLRAENSRYNDTPIYAVFRLLDLEFIFTIVISLFAILFGYDAINGEKERGTLRLTFANAIPRDQYILGKLFGSFLALAVPFLIPIALGCLLVWFMGVPMTGTDWARLGLVIGAGFLYFGAFLALSIFISALTKRSATSFLLLLVIWISTVLIIPRASVFFAAHAVEVPSLDEMTYQRRQLMTQYIQEDMKELSQFMQIGGGGGSFSMSFEANSQEEADAQMQRVNQFMEKQQELAEVRQQKLDAFSERLHEDRRNKQLVQQGLAFNLARISPASSFSLAATTLAGTSLELEERFMQAVNDYQAAFESFMQEKTGQSSAGGFRIVMRMDRDGEEPPPPELINPNDLPAFEYPAPQLSTFVNPALLDFGVLLVFNVVFFLGAFLGFMRYDVR